MYLLQRPLLKFKMSTLLTNEICISSELVFYIQYRINAYIFISFVIQSDENIKSHTYLIFLKIRIFSYIFQQNIILTPDIAKSMQLNIFHFPLYYKLLLRWTMSFTIFFKLNEICKNCKKKLQLFYNQLPFCYIQEPIK